MIFSIGHSNHDYEAFLALLRSAGIGTIADVRSVPYSRRVPHFNLQRLSGQLERDGIGYCYVGQELGGRPNDPELFRDGRADYERMAARPSFAHGLMLLLSHAPSRTAMLCSERDPLDCHRCLLVGRALAAGGVRVGHIRHDGTIESHASTERRLLEVPDAQERDLFTTGQDERLAAAYRRRARAVAYRLNSAKAANRAPDKRTTTAVKKSR